MQIPEEISEIKWIDVFIRDNEPGKILVVFVCEDENQSKNFLSVVRQNSIELIFSFPDKKTRGTGISFTDLDFSQEYYTTSNMSMRNSFLIRSLKKANAFFITSGYKIPDCDELNLVDAEMPLLVAKNNVTINIPLPG